MNANQSTITNPLRRRRITSITPCKPQAQRGANPLRRRRMMSITPCKPQAQRGANPLRRRRITLITPCKPQAQLGVNPQRRRRITLITPCKPQAQRGVKKLFYLIIFVASLVFQTCSDDARPPSCQILVHVSGECMCNVFIYTPEGLCLQSKIYDCQQTTFLTFNIYQEGPLTIKAEYHEKSATVTVTAQYTHSHEVSIIL